MNLYHISAETKGYDVYSDAVVAAKNEQAARETHPSEQFELRWQNNRWEWELSGGWTTYINDTWVNPDQVTVVKIGTAVKGTPAGVICSSFHAG